MAELPFSKQDFLDLKVDEIAGTADTKDQLGYSKVFRAAVNDAETDAQKELLRFLEMLVSNGLRLDHPGDPYSYSDRLDEELLTFFSEIIAEVNDPEIRSRIADILWIRNKDYKIAELAIDSYLTAAKIFEDFEQWTRTQRRLERAMQLAARLGKKNEKYAIVVAAITDLLDRCNGEDPLFLSAELMRLLQERKEGNPNKYGGFCEKLALAAEKNERFDQARRYWDTKAEWHRQAKDEEGEKDARLKYAESYEKESDFNFAKRKPPYMMASHPIEQAINAYRRVPGQEAKVEALKLKLREYQTKAVDEMVPISSGPVDISEIVIESERAVAGKEFINALQALAFIRKPANVAEVRAKVKENRSTYMFSTLFPTRLFSSTGRSVGIQAAEGEEAVLADMFRYVNFSYALVAKGIVEPARRVILEEHPARIHDFYALTSENPLIRPVREWIVARGLHAGLEGDFLTALHFLIPQFEESIRLVLLASGVVPSSFYESGVQDEFNLNKLLSNPKFTEPLNKIFGEGPIFEFRCLLVERFGSNLRNDLSHGLLDVDGFYSADAVYAWWLILHFYSLPRRTGGDKSVDATAGAPESETTSPESTNI